MQRQEDPLSTFSALGRFGKLPPEIRFLIWRLAVREIPRNNELVWPDPRSIHGGGMRDRRNAMAILRTSRVIYDEVVPLIYKGKSFRLTLGVRDAAHAMDWEDYLDSDDHKIETMPGPDHEDSSTSWWHLLDSVSVTIMPPPTYPDPLGHNGQLSENARTWELLALRRKVVRLVTGLTNLFKDPGTGEPRPALGLLDLRILEQPMQSRTWCLCQLFRNLHRRASVVTHMAARTLSDLPWNDLELIMMEFKRLRNIRSAEVLLPRCDPEARYCFDVPLTIDKTMEKSPLELQAPDSHDRVVLEEMKQVCQKWIDNGEKGVEWYTDDLGSYLASP